MLYGTQDFDGFTHFPANQNLAGLTGLSYISKLVGVNESKVLIWAITQRIDIYWIAGKIFADLQAASRLASEEKAQTVANQALATKPRLRSSSS